MYLILDIARGLAALGVFLFHISPIFEKTAPYLMPIAVHGSFGVPLFFVISGYVISASANAALSKKTSPFDFIKRRFLRIFPPFWASIVVVLVVPYIMESVSFLKTGQFIQPASLWQSMTTTEWLGLVSLYKVFLSSGDLQAEFSIVNAVYWTLAIEFQFYLVVFAGLFFKRNFNVFLMGVTATSVLVMLFGSSVNPGLFLHFWLMFSFGIVLFYLQKNNITLVRFFRDRAATISFLATSGILLALLVLIYLGLLVPLMNTLFGNVSLGIAFLASLFLWVASPLERRLVLYKEGGNVLLGLTIRLFVFLGVISYSLYLIHGKIYGLPAMFARQMVSEESVFYPIATIAGTILLSAIFYKYLEKPFQSAQLKKISVGTLK